MSKKNYVGVIGAFNPDSRVSRELFFRYLLSKLSEELKNEPPLTSFPSNVRTTPVLDKVYNECAVHPKTAFEQLQVKRPSDSTTWK